MVSTPLVTGPLRRIRSVDRRRQLIAAAAELFAARGYDAVGVEEVAAAVGVTGPSVYRHFGDKQALLAEVVLTGLADLEARSRSALGAPIQHRTARLLDELTDMAVQRPPAAVVWRWTGVHLDASVQREVARRAHTVLSSWAGAVRVDRPTLGEAEAELLCWAVLSVLGSVSVHRIRIAAGRARQLLHAAGQRVLAVTPQLTGAGAGARVTVPGPLPGVGSRREQILAAAARLFEERGYRAVGVDDIGAAVGIAGPSVYRHFPSKQSVLVAVCQRAAERLAIGAADALRAGGSAGPQEMVRHLVDSYVSALLVAPDLRVGISTDRAAVTGDDRVQLRRLQREYVAHWVGAVRAVHPNLGTPDASVLVHAGLTVANDLARTRGVVGRPGLPEELVALVLAVVDVPAVS